MQGKEFEERNAARWGEYEQTLNSIETMKSAPADSQVRDFSKLPVMFRQVCTDLALARHRMYSMPMNERLNVLVIRGHKLIHRRAGGTWAMLFHFVAVGFPASVRKEWRLLIASTLFFILPLLGIILAGLYWPDSTWIEAILGDQGMDSMDMMYGSGDKQVENLRAEYGSNFRMFGHYISNNIGIDLRLYASGILACLGTLFFLIYNGVAMGAAVVYIHTACDKEAFYSFVASHSSYELIGMVVAGMAGLRIGLGILNPGRKKVARSLMDAGKKSLPLILGAVFLTFLAAIIEGFWSAQAMPPMVKYTVGIAGWCLCVLYFIFAGRSWKKIEGGKIEA